MSKKSSVYFAEPLMELTANLSPRDTVSGRLNRTADRYLEICRNHGVELTEAERAHVENYTDEIFFSTWRVRHLADEIRCTQSAAIDVKVLSDKLTGVGFADLISLVESMKK